MDSMTSGKAHQASPTIAGESVHSPMGKLTAGENTKDGEWLKSERSWGYSVPESKRRTMEVKTP